MLVYQNVKIIIYFGVHVVVPTWAVWIAVDGNGDVYAFETKPTPSEVEDIFEVLGRFDKIGTATLDGLNWRETLTQISLVGHHKVCDTEITF